MTTSRQTSWRQHLAVACLLAVFPLASEPVQPETQPELADEEVSAPESGVALTELQRQAGWRDLLTGGLEGWLGTYGGAGAETGADTGADTGSETGAPHIGPGWSDADGVLHLAAGGQGGDLVSRDSFEDFELSFEWRVSVGANSGVKVRVPYDTPGEPRRGPEYQVLDDAAHPDGRKGTTSAAALYDLVAPVGKPDAPPLQFRRGRILARGDRLEFWLDGQRVVEVLLDSPEFEAAQAASKFAGLPGFAREAGHLVLQDHGDEVWFRRVFIRDLSSPAGQQVALDLGPDLQGWSTLGDARYTGDGTTIVGEVTGGAQSFLYTDRLFGDFILEVDVKLDVIANSGIQVRSTVDPQTDALSGYQIEIDPTERRWSGGLYDERRRGWLDDLSDDDAARAAFDREGWNRYRIECVGPWLRAWVNGVPTADHLDGMTLEGVIGLQVHSGREGRFRWRKLSVRELGKHRWEPLPLELTDAAVRPTRTSWRAPGSGAWVFPLARQASDVSWRIRYSGDAQLRLGLRHPNAEAPLPMSGDPADAGPLQRAEDGSWWVSALMGTGPDSAEIGHVLEVHAYGDRIAVVQDGLTVADVTGASPVRSSAEAGACTLEARVASGQALEIKGVERLVAVPEAR